MGQQLTLTFTNKQTVGKTAAVAAGQHEDNVIRLQSRATQAQPLCLGVYLGNWCLLFLNNSTIPQMFIFLSMVLLNHFS